MPQFKHQKNKPKTTEKAPDRTLTEERWKVLVAAFKKRFGLKDT